MAIQREDWGPSTPAGGTANVPAVVETRQPSRTDQLAPVDWHGTDLARSRAVTVPVMAVSTRTSSATRGERLPLVTIASTFFVGTMR